MDYQTFHGHSHNAQHAQFDPQARLPQSNPPLPYGGPFVQGQATAFPAMGGAMGGSVMPPGMPQNPRAAALHQQQQMAHQHQQQQQLQQQQLQHQHQPQHQPQHHNQHHNQHPYGSPAVMSPAHQQFAPSRQTASPASNSGQQQPYGTPQPQPSPGTLASNGQHINPQGPVKSEPPQPQAHTPVKQTTPSPVSPATHARAQDRMATLLEINSILIKEVCDLQAQGKAGQVGAAPDAKAEGDKPAPSKEYVEYMRRLQVNLAYLAQSAEKTHKPGQQLQPGPAIMSAPSAPVDLVKLYTKLQDLFPGWKGGTVAQVKQSPGPQQRTNSNLSQSQLHMPTQTPQQATPNSAGLQPNWGQNAMPGVGMPGMGMGMGMLPNQAQTKIEPQL